jgi:hypothetical protein
MLLPGWNHRQAGGSLVVLDQNGVLERAVLGPKTPQAGGPRQHQPHSVPHSKRHTATPSNKSRIESSVLQNLLAKCVLNQSKFNQFASHMRSSGSEKFSTRSHASTIVCKSYKRTLYHRDTNRTLRVPYHYSYCYLELSTKNTRALLLGCRLHPMSRLLILGCNTSHHPKSLYRTTEGARGDRGEISFV